MSLLPVCFVIMPFRTKKTEGARTGAPGEVDFDALWDRAYRPAIEDAGYTPIRADLDTGSVIVKDMLERIALADLVLADVSLPNGNVYYELGLRHVAKESGCVLFAAEWSRQLFDIDQFTAVRYALTDGEVPETEADSIREVVVEAIRALRHSRTPWHEFVGGDRRRLMTRGVFRESSRALSRLQAEMRAVRLMGDPRQRREKTLALVARLDAMALSRPTVAIELLHLVRDTSDWDHTVAFVEQLPENVQALPSVQEQYLLALANAGQPEEAIAHLERLIDEYGETPERLGLIGGRYKRLWRAERDRREERGEDAPTGMESWYLDQAIQHCRRGMELDFNEYYCSSNLAQLLLARGNEGDEQRAHDVDELVVAQCERALKRDEDDGWTRATLLGAAFRAGDPNKARQLAMRIRAEGPERWKLESTVADLRDAVSRHRGPDRDALREVLTGLEPLLRGG